MSGSKEIQQTGVEKRGEGQRLAGEASGLDEAERKEVMPVFAGQSFLVLPTLC